MKKILSIIIAISLVVGLLPTFVLAADGDIVLNFNSTTIKSGKPSDGIVLEGANFSIVTGTGKTFDATVSAYDHFIRAQGYMGGGTGAQLPWLGTTSYPDRGQFVVKTDIPTGNYEVKFKGALLNIASMLYVYVDGKYVGLYDGYSPDYTVYAKAGAGEEKTLGKIRIDHGDSEDHSVEILISNAASSKGNNGTKEGVNYNDGSNMLISEITFHPIEELPTVEGIECELPDSIMLGESFVATPKVKLSDGTYKSFNNYTTAKADDTENNINTLVSFNSENLSKELIWNPKNSYSMYETMGQYTAKFTGTTAGEADVRITATVDGVSYTYEKTVWVIDPKNPNPEFSLNLASDHLKATADGSITAKQINKNWTTNGFNFDLDKTTVYANSRTYNIEGKTIMQFQVRSGAWNAWPAKADTNKNLMITFLKNVPASGWYQVSLEGYKSTTGSQASIYAGGKYAGDYNFYEALPTGTSHKKDENIAVLNTIYLEKGENEISLRARKPYYDAQSIVLGELKFTPAEKPSVESVESVIPKTLEVGTSAELTAKAKMTDGTYRMFGYPENAVTYKDLPTEEIVSVTSSNTDAVAVSDVVCVEQLTTADAKKDMNLVIDPITTTYKLTAVAPGTSTVTVTAKIGDITKTTTETVTVPSTELELPGEAADATVSLYVAAENGGSISVTGGNGNPVDNIDAGTRITATANDVAGKVFSHWRNAAGKFMSGEKSYTFVANTNTSIIAVYDELEESSDKVQVSFFNQHKTLIGSKNVDKGTSFVDAKIGVDTSLTGYVFDKWSISDDTEINSLTRAVALYNVADKNYTAYFFDGDETTPASIKNGKYSDSVSYKATGDNFSYWVVNDGSERIVSYDAEISFRLWTDIALKAVYNDAKTAVPTIVLDKEDDAYFIAYIVPEGYTAISAGIVFAKNGTPTVNSCFSRAVSESVSSQGQFTARPNSDESVARGYVMFRDSAGNIRVIYAD